jgi:dynein intermediate chain 1
MTYTRTLVAVNPQSPLNRVNYDFFDRTNKVNDTVDNLAIHFSMEGDYIHTTSAEFKTQ